MIRTWGQESCLDNVGHSATYKTGRGSLQLACKYIPYLSTSYLHLFSQCRSNGSWFLVCCPVPRVPKPSLQCDATSKADPCLAGAAAWVPDALTRFQLKLRRLMGALIKSILALGQQGYELPTACPHCHRPFLPSLISTSPGQSRTLCSVLPSCSSPPARSLLACYTPRHNGKHHNL
jgi:hypothetical protein